MPMVLRFPENPPKPEASADPQAQKIAEAIKLLMSTLSADEQKRVLNEVAEALRLIPAPRASEVLATIAKVLPLRTAWTIKEIKETVAAEGVKAEPKEIYNAIEYLTRKGHVRRVGYGRYLID